MSKGSKRRPQQVDDNKMKENWELIFGPPKKTVEDLVKETFVEALNQSTHESIMNEREK